jgi:nucleoside-diphosphate-sugar epimerase
MKVLFIGGTGLISTAVSQLAIKQGIDLFIMNRGIRHDELSDKVNRIVCDINNETEVKKILDNHYFDVVVDWIAFTVDHVKRDYRLFKGHTKQYVFISSASLYKKPFDKLPVTEEAKLDNQFWGYSKNKEICERYLMDLNDKDFNVTIIRPSHTYNNQAVVAQLNSWQHPYTLINRMRQSKKIIILDQGINLWTLTYNEDFAYAFLDILGNEKAYNEIYHLTSEKTYNWLELNKIIEKALNLKTDIVFIPTNEAVKYFKEYEGALLGDMIHSAVFDNSKIKKVAPNYKSSTGYEDVINKIIKWYDEHEEYKTIDEDFDKRYDELISKY